MLLSLGGLESGLDDLERIRCLRMMVLVWVELNRQFSVELGKLVGLHLLHAGNEHILRGVEELIDVECLLLGYLRLIIVSFLLLGSDKLIGEELCVLVDLLFEYLLALSCLVGI